MIINNSLDFFKLRTFMFDFDGVLVDSGRDIAFSVRHIQKKYGLREMDDDEIYSHLGLGPEHLIKMCTGFSEEQGLSQVISEYRKFYIEHCVQDTTLCPGLPALLHFLKNDYGTIRTARAREVGAAADADVADEAAVRACAADEAEVAAGACAAMVADEVGAVAGAAPGLEDIHLVVVTNKPENISRVILDKLEISQYFEMVVGPESLQKLKPDPEGILRVLSATGTEAGEALMIGDSDTDIFAGRAAGTMTCGRLGGLGRKEPLIEAQPDIIIDTLDELIQVLR